MTYETSDDHRPRSAMPYHPILNTIANVVTAVCAVAIAIKVY
jgi:hypothetical protein